MVYVASLSLMAKKALGPKCHQSSINGIIDTLAKFKSLKGSTKALIIVCGVMAVVAVALIITVLATGGFTNPIG